MLVLFSYFAFNRALRMISRHSQALSQRNLARGVSQDLSGIYSFLIHKKLSDPNDPDGMGIRNLVTQKLSTWPSRTTLPLSLETEYQDLQNFLLSSIQEHIDLNFLSAKIQINREDFKELPFAWEESRGFEKTGVIQVVLEFDSSGKRVRFAHTLPVDVINPIRSELKRFVLWAENGDLDFIPGNEKQKSKGYNRVKQDQDGNLIDFNFNPMVFIPYPYSNRSEVTSLNPDFIYQNCGFVFLGGTRDIFLNLGSGFGPSGEGRHLFVKNPSHLAAGNLYTSGPLSALSDYKIRFRDVGYDWEEARAILNGASPSAFWLPYYANSLGGPYIEETRSSALKLFGLELSPADYFAPTLVIGRVYRRFIRQVSWYHKDYSQSSFAYRGSPVGRGIFYCPPDDGGTTWQNMFNDPAHVYQVASVCQGLGISPDSSGLSRYLSTFSSKVVTENYNHGVDYIRSEGTNPDPTNLLSSSNPYKNSNPGTPSKNFFPKEDLSPGNLELKLQDLLGSGGENAPLARRATIVFPQGSETPSSEKGLKYLESLGLFYENSLDLKGIFHQLRGHLLLKSSSPSVPLKIGSSGVMVVEEGNITLESGISKDREDPNFLMIVAMRGNIFIRTNQEINALLCAPNGTVYYEQTGPCSINGGILVNRFFQNSTQFDKTLKKGLMVQYDKKLGGFFKDSNAKERLIVSIGTRSSFSHVEN